MNASQSGGKPFIGAVTALLLGTAIFIVVYIAVHALGDFLEPQFHVSSVREKATFTISRSILNEWTALAGILLVLRLRGQSFADIGWRRPATLSAWLLGAVVAVLYAGLLLMGPLADMPILSDWSAFRIATGLGLGLSAGVCEEAIFRGFVMTQARDAGMPTVVQIMISAVLFGFAHVGWGSLSGEFNLGAFVGSATATMVLGGALAVIYVAGRRSLTPVIAAHAAIDIAIEPWLVMFAVGGGFAG